MRVCGHFSVVGLSVLACTPYGERLWGLLDPSAEAATQLRLGKDTKLSNHDLLGLVNEHLARRVEDLRQFARKEFQTAGPQTIVLRTSGDSGSIWSVLLQVAIVAAAGYGFLRLSGYPVHDLMFVSRCTLDKMVKPLLDEVQTIWQAAEEGFAEVLAMVRNYREELKGMRGEICGRIEKVDAGVSEVRGEFDQVTAALAKLDEQMDITNQGMQLICAVVAEHVNPPHAPPALRTLGVDTVAHRELPLLHAPEAWTPVAAAGRVLLGADWRGSSSDQPPVANEPPRDASPADVRRRIAGIVAAGRAKPKEAAPASGMVAKRNSTNTPVLTHSGPRPT